MKTFKIAGVAVALAAGLAIPSGAARAQAVAAAEAASVAAAPIVRAVHAVARKPRQGGDWLKADVIHFDSHSIIVREAANERMIHTFSYASVLQPKMQALEDKGGYRYGDQVKILYQPGQTVALAIHGKPSKPQ
ncbi:MAG: hypothetical protein KGL75_14040 [Acidobacteriota bacterium]|nr:hypothetical protein [Acidobacteriota bacterium]